MPAITRGHDDNRSLYHLKRLEAGREVADKDRPALRVEIDQRTCQYVGV
jgi:hypothetical protein